ncbi:unnamed protein product [Mesocestoides corti]|uniref:Major facilitator superfamily (MFS) profile domain-containing protein n=1 Tax=Mesocestoides corti TaxID=53468 RepID=A0A0R3UK88_MESCO|nr:unnamed protein product [Mesocestoides corti]
MRKECKNPIDTNDKGHQDKGWAWVVVFGAFLIHFLTAGCEKSFSLWYIEVLEVFSTNSATAASLGGICAAVRLILGRYFVLILLTFVAPVSVMLCDKFTIQIVVILGGVISSIGLLISSMTSSPTVLFIGFGLIYGFGLTLVFTPALVVCTVYFEKRRATALSLSLTGAGFGAFVVPQVVAQLLYRYGYRGAMLIMSAFVLHYCISGAVFFTPISDRRRKQNSQKEDLSSTVTTSCFNKLKSKLLFIELFRDPWFALFILSFVFNMMGSGPVTTLIIHYSEEYGIELSTSLFLFAIEGGVQVLARSLSGLLFDLKTVKKVRGIVWCADIIASGTIVCFFALAKTFAGLAILMSFRGLFLAIYISHQTLMTCDMCNKPKDSGLLPHAIGMTQLSKGFGILLGAMFSGELI